MTDTVSTTPFDLLRRGRTIDEIVRIQHTLRQQGKSLWDWASFVCLYSDSVPMFAPPPSSSGVYFRDPAEKDTKPDTEEERWTDVLSQILHREVDRADMVKVKRILTSAQQQLLILRYSRGYPLKTIAALTGASVGQVCKTIQKIVNRVQEVY